MKQLSQTELRRLKEANPFEHVIPEAKQHLCSKYARLAAKKHFDLEYNPANAWDFHKKKPGCLEKRRQYLELFIKAGKNNRNTFA